MNKFLGIILILMVLSCKKHECRLPIIKRNTDTIAVKTDSMIKEQSANEEALATPDTLSRISKPFVIDNVKYYWEFTLIFIPKLDSGDGKMVLKNYKTGKSLFTDTDIYSSGTFEKLDFDENNKKNFRDINFDGYKDYAAYSDYKTGQGGDIYDVYLFNKKTLSFKYSEELEGGLELNPTTKSISSFWHTGAGMNSTAVHYFDNNGHIKYTKVYTTEFLTEDSEIQTYKKIINKKVVEIKIDTTSREY